MIEIENILVVFFFVLEMFNSTFFSFANIPSKNNEQ